MASKRQPGKNYNTNPKKKGKKKSEETYESSKNNIEISNEAQQMACSASHWL